VIPPEAVECLQLFLVRIGQGLFLSISRGRGYEERRCRAEFPDAVYSILVQSLKRMAGTAGRGSEMFTKSAAVELGQCGIRVNCVAPGAIEIERTRLEASGYAATWAGLTPLGRVGQPLDVGRAVVFMAGESADFITGQAAWVDGGLFSRPAWPY
jgi:hypothetical protein